MSSTSDKHMGRGLLRTRRRGRKLSPLNLMIAFAAQAGLTLLVYPSAAAWVSQANQSNVVEQQASADAEIAQATKEESLRLAREYNAQLTSGALLAGGAEVAEGTGSSAGTLDYWDQLHHGPTEAMARIRIPSINLDLPVYHGTSDETLLLGIGHLQGTSLPVGGEGQRSVLTGHRGLANATMFTKLPEVELGDDFTVEVLGEVFSYRVVDISVVEPDSTHEIRPEEGRDLVTLVTCTPLGINTQRILVTGERVIPTPQKDLDAAGSAPDVPGFPWWAVIYGTGTAGIGAAYWAGSRRTRPATRGKAAQGDQISAPGEV